MKALQGVKVLDCTHAVAGPWASMILADLGADVIKIEPVEGARFRFKLPNYTPWDIVNRNKRAIAVDIHKVEGQQVIQALSKQADVFIENFRPGVLDKKSLGYTHLSALNKGLIYCSISGFGHDGPYRKRGAMDLITQAISGIMSYIGPRGSTAPNSTGLPLSDLTAGTYAAVGILAALHHRHATGEGQHVETTLQESALAYTLWESASVLHGGASPKPRGTRSTITTPYEAYKAKDSYLVVAIPSEYLWGKFCEGIEAVHLKTDPRYLDRSQRMPNRDALQADIEIALATQTATYWSAQLTALGVPSAPVNNMAAALQDPQIKARGMIETIDGQSYLRVPIKMSKTPVGISRPAASIGEHSQEVLKEAGFSEEELVALMGNKIVKG